MFCVLTDLRYYNSMRRWTSSLVQWADLDDCQTEITLKNFTRFYYIFYYYYKEWSITMKHILKTFSTSGLRLITWRASLSDRGMQSWISNRPHGWGWPGVPADLDPPRFGLPGPNPLADMDPRSKSASGYGPPPRSKSVSRFGPPPQQNWVKTSSLTF